jgi:hypothetical protein
MARTLAEDYLEDAGKSLSMSDVESIGGRAVSATRLAPKCDNSSTHRVNTARDVFQVTAPI